MELREVIRNPLREDERGIVLCRPPIFSENGLEHEYGMLQPYELRKYLLYWDRIARPGAFVMPSPENAEKKEWTWDFSKPENFIVGQTNDDNLFLEREGIIEPQKAFVEHDEAIPENRYFLANKRVVARLSEESSGWSAEHTFESVKYSEESKPLLQYRINNILPAPIEATPLHDILEFKEKNRTNLIYFHQHMDKLYSAVLSSEHPKITSEQALNKLAIEISGIREGLDRLKIKHVTDSIHSYLSSERYDLLEKASAGALLANLSDFSLQYRPTGAAIAIGVKVGVDAIKHIASQQNNIPYKYIQLARRNFKL